MKWYLLQLVMLVMWHEFNMATADDWDEDDDDDDDDESEDGDKELTCPPKHVKGVSIDADKLLKGSWNYVKCTPSVLCDHFNCFSNTIDKEGHMSYSVDSIAYNTSSKTHWKSEATCKANPQEGKLDIKASDPKVDGEYYVLGTDYDHWKLLFSCRPDHNGVKKPAAWIGSRGNDLDPSVTPAVKECVKKFGLVWDKFRSITDKSCERYKEDYGD